MTGILLIHGFAGPLSDISPLYRALCQAGYKVEMPVLPGHDALPKSLRTTNYSDWLCCAKNAANKLLKHCDTVTAIGFSMGGLIAMHIYPEVLFHSLVTINTPYYFWNGKMILKNLFTNFGPSVSKYFGSHIPVHALLQFCTLLSRTRPLLPKVACPTLLVQTQDDDTAWPSSAVRFAKRLSGPCKIVTPKAGGHMVLTGPSQGEVLSCVLEFLNPSSNKRIC